MTSYDLGNDDLLALEQRLKAQLNPVQPDREFVSNLRKRLEITPVDQQRRTNASKLLLIGVGLTTGFAIFLLGRDFLQNKEKTSDQ